MSVMNPLSSLKCMHLLEQRIVLDAAGAAEFMTDATPQQTAQDDHMMQETADFREQLSKEIVFVDSAVRNYQDLLGSKINDVDIYILNAEENAFTQMTNILSTKENISAIHVISHGNVGAIELAGEIYDAKALEAYQDEMMAWRDSLREGADILLYGCRIGANQEGLDFMNEFAMLTGADILASEDLTAAEDLGGNFILERRIGEIEAMNIVDLQTARNFREVLESQPIVSFEIGAVNALFAAATDTAASVTPRFDIAVTQTESAFSQPDLADISVTEESPILNEIFEQSNLSESSILRNFDSLDPRQDSVLSQKGQYIFELKHSFPLSTNFSTMIIQPQIENFYCMHIDEVDGEIKWNVMDLNYTDEVEEVDEEELLEKFPAAKGFISQIFMQDHFSLQKVFDIKF